MTCSQLLRDSAVYQGILCDTAHGSEVPRTARVLQREVQLRGTLHQVIVYYPSAYWVLKGVHALRAYTIFSTITRSVFRRHLMNTQSSGSLYICVYLRGNRITTGYTLGGYPTQLGGVEGLLENGIGRPLPVWETRSIPGKCAPNLFHIDCFIFE